MPSYLDFDSTKKFRDFILAKTLNVPNGPQTFNNSNYTVQNLNDEPNIDQGSVDQNRNSELNIPRTRNTFKPLTYFVKESLDDLPRRANLALYADDSGNPYFVAEKHNLVGIMSNSSYNTESELFKFAASYIRDTTQKGPVYSRIQQNLYKSTVGRVRLIDALEGNTATALNIITGREPLVESNFSITVSKTAPGKAVDFLQTVAGTQLPFSTIPGDYFAPAPNPLNTRPTPNSEFGKILQDASGALGSLLGISRRPKSIRKPSDLFIEYMGSGQKQVLFDQLTYNTYAPNYTTTARSQNTSKIFNFVDKVAQGVKTILGSEAPKGSAYIGDDRGDSVLNAMNDLNQRPVRSSYYLSLMFDPVQTILFNSQKNIGEGGQSSGPLTWISINSRNRLGENNMNYGEQRSQFENSLSTKGNFRHDSILGYTQDLLDSMPSDGGEAKSHVANVIDQTSRIFREGNKYLSRGSAIKYVDKFGQDSGVEYCRTWTKDRPYLTYNDTMKKGMNTRKYEGSVMTNPWNLNIGPMSDGNKGFDGSSNIFNGYKYGPDKDGKSFYAKKYMFSIENLAWKTSNKPGFTVLDLPFSERGPNGGRVMWFPPYDLKVTESNNARWDSNTFLGRPEPIFTYNSTERSGTVGFKVVVDHPSILNLLTREFFKNMSEEESDNYINAFFAGCKDLDFYDLIRKYTTLSKNDEELIKQYLNEGGSTTVIQQYKTKVEPVTDNGNQTQQPTTQDNTAQPTSEDSKNYMMFFDNDEPGSNPDLTTYAAFDTLATDYINNKKSVYVTTLGTNLGTLSGAPSGNSNVQSDKQNIYGNINDGGGNITEQTTKLEKYFTDFETDFNDYKTKVSTLKDDLTNKKVQTIELKISSATSSIASVEYNKRLSHRRSYSLVKDFFNRISNNKTVSIKWTTDPNQELITYEYKLKDDLGWSELDGTVKVTVTNYGESFSGATNTPIDTNCKNRDFKYVTNLNIVAPISFYCRHSEIQFKKTLLPGKVNPVNPNPPQKNVKTSISEDGKRTITKELKKPPIDVMKRIIMKTLSEAYYFKKLEENSPLVFKSLKEKLRYFHPGFHSMTPEGLNSRLTFLLQCIRPGDTIPIKGTSDELDTNARNTSFGPPPVCILRIGDFYHSKIIIRDVNITYDEGLWDMNPEGIGIQPMIANVTLSINFIGGQGLEKPVERLQNALSSNFFANTEIYDERSESTNSKIAGQDADKFTKAFLEDLQNRGQKEVIPQQATSLTPTIQDKYIGSLSNNQLEYKDIVKNVYTKTNAYMDSFKEAFNSVNQKYGPLISNLVFSQTYRSINSFDVYTSTGGSPGRTINLLGIYSVENDFGNLLRNFIYVMKDKIKNSDLSTLMGFNVFLSSPKSTRLNTILIPYVTKVVSKKLNDLIDANPTSKLETALSDLVQSIDLTNYVVKYGEDIKFTGSTANDAIVATLSGTVSGIYIETEGAIDYISTNSPAFYTGLTTSINFNSPSIDDSQLSQMLSVLLYDETSNILSEIEKQPTIFDDTVMPSLRYALFTFVQLINPTVFTFTPMAARNEDITLLLDVSIENPKSSGDDVTEGLKVLNTKTNITTTNLNFYRK